jgi:uncharacterized protein
MRWRDGRRSENVEDGRGTGGGGGGFGGGGLKLGLGGIVLLAAAYFLGLDPRMVMGLMQATQSSTVSADAGPVATGAPKDEAGDFMSVVLADTEDTWGEIFRQGGSTYTPPKMRFFEGGTRSGCGAASTESGPFYCPADQRVYIDLAFFRELEERFQAPGDFAQAYVVAHEVGHHVQHLLGIADKVRNAQDSASQGEQNQLQVRMELQADCFAGIWANHAQRSRQILENGDIEEAMGAASAVGDDIIQKRAQGHVVPESFTHGSAAQRQQWFQRGLQNGTLKACDTFAGM